MAVVKRIVLKVSRHLSSTIRKHVHVVTLLNMTFFTFLMQAKIDFNCCLSENGSLRETFDHMRLEKKTFDTIRLKLEKELVENKQKIMEGIETSTTAYEARLV